MAARTPVIAVAMASTAVVLSLIALLVVVGRSHPANEPETQRELAVAAADVVTLRDNVELAKGEDLLGVRVTDERLRKALGLEVADVITVLGGRVIKKESDIAKALAGVKYADATLLYVDLVRDGEPLVVRWKLDDPLKSTRVDRDPVLRPAPSSPLRNPFLDPDDPLDPGLLSQIIKLDELHYVIPRTTLEGILANPAAAARGARMVPTSAGIKIYAVRPSSLFATLGLKNGDALREVNGFPIDDPAKVLDLYTKLRDATSFEITLTRRGRDESLRIEIR